MQMAESYTTSKITVQRPKLNPKITLIGYGNPRYNSMVAYKNGVLVTVGSHVRWVDIQNNKVLFDKQIGCSQIYQLMQNSKYILLVNFDGLITLLSKQDLSLKYQFYAPGKEIRHSSLTDYPDNNYLAVSCQLNQGTHGSKLAVYSLENIQRGQYQPIYQCSGHFYYPEFYQRRLIVVEHNDPNPKGRKRKQTVMNKKLPITNRIVKFSDKFTVQYSYNIKSQGQIISASQNKGIIYYLHNGKRATILDARNERVAQVELQSKGYPYLLQQYQDGAAFTNSNHYLVKINYDFQNNKLHYTKKEIKSSAIGQNVALKFTSHGLYSLNQNGLHFYCYDNKKTYTQSIFFITNCGLAFNESGDKFAVADFGGNIFVFSAEQVNYFPTPLYSVCVGNPVRSIAWCTNTNKILIGCVGGGLYKWEYGSTQAKIIHQFHHTVNILRADNSKIYAGLSDGKIKIFDSSTMKLVYQFKAHHPINYQTQEERQLFGSMKNYAEIWSLILSPNKQDLHIVSSSEDQTEKVFSIDVQSKNNAQKYHLKGHQLAVTSVDWKIMNQQLKQIYVSCSDDKIIRFRDPNNGFKILFQVETSTIKQWHTLTYLALEPLGSRVAVGSQNGYLFIYDICKRQLLFGQKIHLGGIQGLQWKNNKIITCSSDLCINIIEM